MPPQRAPTLSPWVGWHADQTAPSLPLASGVCLPSCLDILFPKVKEWFSGEWSLYNECAIIYKVNGELQTRRPDRVMMKDDEVIVVDFKFGKPYPEYNEQVREYMNLLQCMGYKRVSGYLWYVFYNILEEIE